MARQRRGPGARWAQVETRSVDFWNPSAPTTTKHPPATPKLRRTMTHRNPHDGESTMAVSTRLSQWRFASVSMREFGRAIALGMEHMGSQTMSEERWMSR